jgi:hypothetical protein
VPPGEAKPIFSDLYVSEMPFLVEAKGSVARDLNDAIGLFVADRNVERFTGALVQAAKASGLAK